MKISLVTEYLSDNLGDAIIADVECHLIHSVAPGAEIRMYDLSCRKRRPPYTEEWSRTGIRLRLGNMLGFAHALRNVVSAFYPGSTTRKYFRSICDESDIVLIGGGQLLLDHRLRFPSKLFALAKELSKRPGLPCIIFGVGVARKWSFVGRLLVHALIARCSTVTVRDTESRSRLLALFHSPPPIQIHADSALFAKETYSTSPHIPSTNKRVGLGIMAALPLQHAYATIAKFDEKLLISFWQSVAEGLLSNGYTVCVFTNGNKRDTWLAKKVIEAIRGEHSEEQSIKIWTPTSPSELASCISHLDCVVAFRLHAIIVAVSLDKSIVPLYWDEKTNGFLELIGASERAIRIMPENCNPILEAIKRGGVTYSKDQINAGKDRILQILSKAIQIANELP